MSDYQAVALMVELGQVFHAEGFTLSLLLTALVTALKYAVYDPAMADIAQSEEAAELKEAEALGDPETELAETLVKGIQYAQAAEGSGPTTTPTDPVAAQTKVQKAQPVFTPSIADALSGTVEPGLLENELASIPGQDVGQLEADLLSASEPIDDIPSQSEFNAEGDPDSNIDRLKNIFAQITGDQVTDDPLAPVDPDADLYGAPGSGGGKYDLGDAAKLAGAADTILSALGGGGGGSSALATRARQPGAPRIPSSGGSVQGRWRNSDRLPHLTQGYNVAGGALVTPGELAQALSGATDFRRRRTGARRIY